MNDSRKIAVRWQMLLLLFVARTGLGFQFQSLGSVSPQLIDELGLSYREVGTLIGLFTMAGIFLSIPAGMALRLTSERVLVTFGLLALAIGGAVAALSIGFGVIAFGRLLCGVGFVLSTIYLTKMIADWFAGKELATAMSIFVMSWPIGIALGQVLHPWLAASFGWRTAFGVAAVYCLIGSASVALFYRAPTGDTQTNARSVNRLSSRALKLTLIASMVLGLFNAGYIVYVSFVEHLLVDGGLKPLHAATVASIPSWIMITTAPVAGHLADRTRRPDLILYVCMTAAASTLLLLRFTDIAIPAVLLFGLMGTAPAGIIMALSGQAMSAEARAFGMGVFFTGNFVILTAAPVLAGWSFDLTGDPFAPLAFGAALFAAAGFANALFRQMQRRH